MDERIRLLKEEVEKDFFGVTPRKIDKTIKVEIIKKEVSEREYDFVSHPLRDLLLNRNQNIRQQQLRNINNARMGYNDHRYAEDFETLDSVIDDIEEDIFRCKKIDEMAFKYGVKAIVFASWCRGSIHIDRIRLAYIMSADYQMELSTQVLEDGINDKKLQIQYAGLIRELSLAHSRQAGFKNQARYGKRPDLIQMEKPVQQISDDQMRHLINEFRQMKIAEISSNDYMSFEMIKQEPLPVVQPSQDEQIQNIINSAKNDDETFSLDEIK